MVVNDAEEGRHAAFIYLDQNDWVTLAKVRKRKPDVADLLPRSCPHHRACSRGMVTPEGGRSGSTIVAARQVEAHPGPRTR